MIPFLIVALGLCAIFFRASLVWIEDVLGKRYPPSHNFARLWSEWPSRRGDVIQRVVTAGLCGGGVVTSLVGIVMMFAGVPKDETSWPLTILFVLSAVLVIIVTPWRLRIFERRDAIDVAYDEYLHNEAEHRERQFRAGVS